MGRNDEKELERMIKAEEIVQRRAREEKLSKEEWKEAFDSSGFINFDALREKIYLGVGISAFLPSSIGRKANSKQNGRGKTGSGAGNKA